MKSLFSIYKNAFRETFVPPGRRDKTGCKTSERFEFIDLAKGVCIVFVCAFHSHYAPELPRQLFLLLIPLFFFLSGLFFKDYGQLVNYMERKLNRIFIPAIFFYSASYLIRISAEYLHVGPSVTAGYFDFIWNNAEINVPLWFLFSLFNLNVIFCLLYYVLNKNAWLIGIFCLALGVAGYALSINETRLFLYLDCSLTCMPFFYCGWALRNTNISRPSRYDNKLFIISLLVFSSIFLIDKQNDVLQASYVNNYFGKCNPLLFYVMSLISVTSFLFILKKIKWLPIISYFGRYSLIVLGTHAILSIVASQVGEHLGDFYSFILTYILCWLTIPLINEYIPWMGARKDLLKISRLKKLAA